MQESIDVALVQQEVLNAVKSINQTQVGDLDSRLLDISELYNHYAVPLNLHEIILLILHTSGHKDRGLIESTWTSVIQSSNFY